MRLIEIVSRRRNGGKLLHVDNFRDKNRMCVKFNLLNNIRADKRVGTLSYGESAVLGALNFIEVGKFVDVAPALEAEMLKQIESRHLGDNWHGKFFCFSYDVVREIGFVHRDRNSVLSSRRSCHLRHGVDNASVVLVAVAGTQHEETVLNVE